MACTVVLVPMALVRWFPNVQYRLARYWWRLRRPVTRGARVILPNEAVQICLVRHSYGSGATPSPTLSAHLVMEGGLAPCRAGVGRPPPLQPIDLPATTLG